MKTKSKLVLGLSILSAATLAAGATSTFAWYGVTTATAQTSKVFATAKNSAAGLTLSITAEKAVEFGGTTKDIIATGTPTSSQIVLNDVHLLPAINTTTSSSAGTQSTSAYALSAVKSYVKYGDSDYREDTAGMAAKHAGVLITLSYDARSLNSNVSYNIAITEDKQSGDNSVPWLVGKLGTDTYTNINTASALTIVGGTNSAATFFFYVDGTNVGADGSSVDIDAHSYQFVFTPTVVANS